MRAVHRRVGAGAAEALARALPGRVTRRPPCPRRDDPPCAARWRSPALRRLRAAVAVALPPPPTDSRRPLLASPPRGSREFSAGRRRAATCDRSLRDGRRVRHLTRSDGLAAARAAAAG